MYNNFGYMVHISIWSQSETSSEKVEEFFGMVCIKLQISSKIHLQGEKL